MSNNKQSLSSTLNIIFGTSVALTILGIIFLFIASAIIHSIFYMVWTFGAIFLLVGILGVLFIPTISQIVKEIEEYKRKNQ